jgi:hypothetical protein
LQDDVQKLLKPFARSAYTGKSSNSSSTAELVVENALDKRCRDSYAAFKQFENTHNLSVQSMGVGYTAARSGLVSVLLEAGAKLKIRNDVAHDAVLLMDRAMSASMKVGAAEAAAAVPARHCLLRTLLQLHYMKQSLVVQPTAASHQTCSRHMHLQASTCAATTQAGH